jgi:hypothetical protein
VSARRAIVTIAIALVVAGCVHRWMHRRVTGTCEGACTHYIGCRRAAGLSADTEQRCRRECPEVFGDARSLEAFESLDCADVIEYVDGVRTKAATAQ